MTRVSSIQDKKKKKKKKRWKMKKYRGVFVFHVQKGKHGTKENTAITSFDDFNGLRYFRLFVFGRK